MKCDFCNRNINKDTIGILGIGNKHTICEDCLVKANEVLKEVQLKRMQKNNSKLMMKPSEIKAKLDEYVIGQEEAKSVLSVAVYNHYKMLTTRFKEDDIVVEKSNVLMLGPTGCGKTFIVKTLASIVDVPFAIADATGITEAGYVGQDAEVMLQKLIQAADGDVKRAEQGIIFIDEIDKLTRKSENPSITRDVGGEGVQQTLLKIIEGNIIDVPVNAGRRHPNGETVQIDTSKILFICGGSFEGIEKIVEKRLSQNSAIGFGQTQTSKKSFKPGEAMLKATADDIRKFGIIPELLGRLPVITALHDLDEQALTDILTKPKNALYKQYQKLLSMDGVTLSMTKEAFNEVAKEAIKRHTGARSLRSIMEETLRPYMYKIPDIKEAKELIIDQKTVKHEEEAVIKLKENIGM